MKITNYIGLFIIRCVLCCAMIHSLSSVTWARGEGRRDRKKPLALRYERPITDIETWVENLTVVTYLAANILYTFVGSSAPKFRTAAISILVNSLSNFQASYVIYSHRYNPDKYKWPLALHLWGILGIESITLSLLYYWEGFFDLSLFTPKNHPSPIQETSSSENEQCHDEQGAEPSLPSDGSGGQPHLLFSSHAKSTKNPAALKDLSVSATPATPQLPQ